MITVTKIFSFAAAHYLPNHLGLCKNLHGHNYKLEITVGKEKLNSNSMIIDFGKLKEIVNKEIIEKYDHSYLNEFFLVPTAEEMVIVFYRKLQTIFEELFISLVSVKLWETDSCFAEIKREGGI